MYKYFFRFVEKQFLFFCRKPLTKLILDRLFSWLGLTFLLIRSLRAGLLLALDQFWLFFWADQITNIMKLILFIKPYARVIYYLIVFGFWLAFTVHIFKLGFLLPNNIFRKGSQEYVVVDGARLIFAEFQVPTHFFVIVF